MAKARASFYGFNPPFIGGSQNIMSRQEDDRLIKNDILQLLMTAPGERVMRPDFGVPLRTFVFEQAVDADLSVLEDIISEAIAEHEPRVTVSQVSVVSDPDRNGLSVKVVVRLKKDPTKELSIEKFITSEA